MNFASDFPSHLPPYNGPMSEGPAPKRNRKLLQILVLMAIAGIVVAIVRQPQPIVRREPNYLAAIAIVLAAVLIDYLWRRHKRVSENHRLD